MIDDVDQVVRYTTPLGQARFGRADIHAPIQCRRIESDDLRIEPGARATPTAVLPDAVGPVR